MAYKRISVIKETKTGKNVSFKDNKTGKTMTDKEFSKKIDNGLYPNYHNRVINNKKTPCSNPDGKPGNNLG